MATLGIEEKLTRRQRRSMISRLANVSTAAYGPAKYGDPWNSYFGSRTDEFLIQEYRDAKWEIPQP